MFYSLRCSSLIFWLVGLLGWVVTTPAVGQPTAEGKSYRYVTVQSAGKLVATHVKTKRVRLGKSEYVDIINIAADSSEFLRQTDFSVGLSPIYPSDRLLLTLAVLPDVQTGLVTWTRLDPDTLRPTDHLPLLPLLQEAAQQLVLYKNQRPLLNTLTHRLDLRPIIYEAGHYWTTSNDVLTEYYVVRTQPEWFVDTQDAVTLNCSAQLFTPTDLAALQKRVAATFPNPLRRPHILGELTSKFLLSKIEKDIYTFSSIPPRIFDLDPAVGYFGAVAVKYKLDVGLISGKYPNHFWLSKQEGIDTLFDTISIEKL